MPEPTPIPNCPLCGGEPEMRATKSVDCSNDKCPLWCEVLRLDSWFALAALKDERDTLLASRPAPPQTTEHANQQPKE